MYFLIFTIGPDRAQIPTFWFKDSSQTEVLVDYRVTTSPIRPQEKPWVTRGEHGGL